jgi:hypothetical protein
MVRVLLIWLRLVEVRLIRLLLVWLRPGQPRSARMLLARRDLLVP